MRNRCDTREYSFRTEMRSLPAMHLPVRCEMRLFGEKQSEDSPIAYVCTFSTK